jgi:Insertion element 4 transposase N-terminal
VSLPGRVALGVPTRLVTCELVEDVLADTGRKEQRKSLLPARVTVYFVHALALVLFAPPASGDAGRWLDWSGEGSSLICVGWVGERG